VRFNSPLAKILIDCRGTGGMPSIALNGIDNVREAIRDGANYNHDTYLKALAFPVGVGFKIRDRLILLGVGTPMIRHVKCIMVLHRQ
jgi:hypothetical protein